MACNGNEWRDVVIAGVHIDEYMRATSTIDPVDTVISNVDPFGTISLYKEIVFESLSFERKNRTNRDSINRNRCSRNTLLNTENIFYNEEEDDIIYKEYILKKELVEKKY